MKREYLIIIIGILAVSGIVYLYAFRPRQNGDSMLTDVEQNGDSLLTDVEQIVEASVRAMGGEEVIGDLSTLRITQNWPDHGILRTEIERPNKERLGDHLIWNGTYCGLIGSDVLVPEEEWKDNEIDIAWFVPAFFDYAAESDGIQTVDGVETYKIQVALPCGALMTYYINTETHLIFKATANYTVYGDEYYVERTYSNYREVDGLLYPHKFTYQGRDGVTTLTATIRRLEINVNLDDRFKLP